jgi:hypothetical protein
MTPPRAQRRVHHAKRTFNFHGLSLPSPSVLLKQEAAMMTEPASWNSASRLAEHIAPKAARSPSYSKQTISFLHSSAASSLKSVNACTTFYSFTPPLTNDFVLGNTLQRCRPTAAYLLCTAQKPMESSNKRTRLPKAAPSRHTFPRCVLPP